MEHKERFAFTQELCDRIVQRYGKEIVVAGVFGSTARGNDTEWSDVEMLFIVEDACGLQGKQVLYRDITVGYYVKTRSKLEEYLTEPRLNDDSSWPFMMGVLSILKVLHGKQSQVDAWLQMGRAVPDEKFKEALAGHLPAIMVESYGRLLSCKARQNDDDWYCAVLEVLFEMKNALCLLNKSWVTHDYYQGMIDSFEFRYLPERYKELVPLLWHARDIDEAIIHAKELVQHFNVLLSEHGIQPVVYTNGADIPV